MDDTRDANVAGPDAEVAARARLDALFESFNRLTPDELGRIGMGSWDEEVHEDLRGALDAAAERTGRSALADEARARARDTVLRRYSAGTLHPTWAGLNWGLSQGTVDDRVAIVRVLSDAAEAAVLADALAPDVHEALALPAEAIIGMAGGMASEGSLAHAMGESADPDLGRPKALRRTLAFVAGVLLFVTILPLLTMFSVPVAPLVALAAAVGVVLVALRR